MQTILLYSLLIYFLVLTGLAFFMSKRLESEADFLVAGRKFNLWMTSFCLFATWFGAGTLIAATDEVAKEGLIATALEPYGAGLCLILTGIFFARPLWQMKLMTFADLFRQKFGPRVELIGVVLNIPIYVGWIAVQIVSLANILAVFFPVPIWALIIGITLFTSLLTLVGGMWSVGVTDSFQLLVIIIGLVYLLMKMAGIHPDGLSGLFAQVDPEKLTLIPTEDFSDLFNWLGVLSIAALGNMTGQDLGQRIFSANSEKTAQLGCYISGVGYIVIGSIPVFLGLTASETLGSFEGSVIPQLIKNYLDPVTAVILTLTIVSAVVSTITSALLSPSSMISHNFLKYKFPDVSSVHLCRLGVILVSLISLITAFLGEDVYSILESSYAIGFVGFFVPVTLALYSKKLDETACLVSIGAGILIWSPEFFGFDQIPYSLIAVLMGYPIYFATYEMKRSRVH